MKESTWNECIESGDASPRSPNVQKAKSLMMIAQGRLKFLTAQQKTQENVNYIFEGYYASLLEFLHALLVKKGYKVDNHICLGYYLRDVLREDDIFRDFDDCRTKRNALVYYGELMPFDIACQAIERSKVLMQKIEALYAVL